MGSCPAHPQPHPPDFFVLLSLSFLIKPPCCPAMCRWALGWESPIFPGGRHLNKPLSFTPAPVSQVWLWLQQEAKPGFGYKTAYDYREVLLWHFIYLFRFFLCGILECVTFVGLQTVGYISEYSFLPPSTWKCNLQETFLYHFKEVFPIVF